QRTFAATSEDPLLGTSRGRDSRRNQRLEEEAGLNGSGTQTRDAHGGSAKGNHCNRKSDRAHQARHAEGKHLRRSRRAAFRRARRRLQRFVLRHQVRYAAARPRPCIYVWRCKSVRGSEIVHLSAWDGFGLGRDIDAAGICVLQSEREEELRVRNQFLVTIWY